MYSQLLNTPKIKKNIGTKLIESSLYEPTANQLKLQKEIGYSRGAPMRTRTAKVLQSERDSGLTAQQISKKYGIGVNTIYKFTRKGETRISSIDLDQVYDFLMLGHSVNRIAVMLDMSPNTLRKAMERGYGSAQAEVFIKNHQEESNCEYMKMTRQQLIKLIKFINPETKFTREMVDAL